MVHIFSNPSFSRLLDIQTASDSPKRHTIETSTHGMPVFTHRTPVFAHGMPVFLHRIPACLYFTHGMPVFLQEFLSLPTERLSLPCCFFSTNPEASTYFLHSIEDGQAQVCLAALPWRGSSHEFGAIIQGLLAMKGAL